MKNRICFIKKSSSWHNVARWLPSATLTLKYVLPFTERKLCAYLRTDQITQPNNCSLITDLSYSSNKIRKTQNEHLNVLNIACKNLNSQ